jgi:hypothetical protein
MSVQRDNIGIKKIDSIIVIAILFLGFLFYNNSTGSTSELKRTPVPALIAVSDNIAVSSQCLRIQVFQKTWILNKDNFNLLAFNRNPLSESRRAGIKAVHCNILIQDYRKIPIFILLFHQYPDDAGEPPYLG